MTTGWKSVARTPSFVISTWFRTDEGVRPTFFNRRLIPLIELPAHASAILTERTSTRMIPHYGVVRY